MWSLYDIKFNKSNLDEYCFEFGCSKEQLVMALECYNDFREHRVVKGGGTKIEKMTEEEKDNFRKFVEMKSSYICDLGDVHVGYFNRNGDYHHEGYHYYNFKYSDWYKPTICNLEEVYSKMSDIEKYNVELIKSHEAKVQ